LAGDRYSEIFQNCAADLPILADFLIPFFGHGHSTQLVEYGYSTREEHLKTHFPNLRKISLILASYSFELCFRDLKLHHFLKLNSLFSSSSFLSQEIDRHKVAVGYVVGNYYIASAASLAGWLSFSDAASLSSLHYCHVVTHLGNFDLSLL